MVLLSVGEMRLALSLRNFVAVLPDRVVFSFSMDFATCWRVEIFRWFRMLSKYFVKLTLTDAVVNNARRISLL